jgi:membrane protease YdiL (CAAX protease family)
MSVVKTSTSFRSPLSPTLWPPDAFVWWRSLLFAVAIVVAAIGASILFVAVWALRFGPKSISATAPSFVLWTQTAVYLPLLLLLLFVLPLLARRSLTELGLRVPTFEEVGWGLAGSVGMFAVISAIGAIEERFFHLKIQETAVDLLKSTTGIETFFFALFACLAAPLVEEFVFRGFIFNALLRYAPAGVAAVLSALLFGLAHADPNSLNAVLPLAGGGVVLALVYYRTGALTASMISHAVFNLASVIGLLFFKAG